ncbi:hypothetical protein TPY_1461 [Sulfobacillus acidophilus TPY]|uniref:Uncharacterized protein n=1 Tax=Sulfobacillus acidophilus (strain ATCC 700253 / DSM 10332 / NAL) TaxID=679936 RepID=G8U0H2_SULAD|nr:hypothetical protein TPY_1461 [Sulfobacillus acidophilus TPY]AEW04194.1 hypothetical protein Sulac_0686 [Sulfobacillus acidophilus DSM 10332]
MLPMWWALRYRWGETDGNAIVETLVRRWPALTTAQKAAIDALLTSWPS